MNRTTKVLEINSNKDASDQTSINWSYILQGTLTVLAVLAMVGFWGTFAYSMITENVKLAMAFAAEPKMLLLDEPFAGLGDQEVDEIVDVLKRHTHNKTILVVEHKVSKLTDFVDRLAVLNAGEIISYGDCEQTLNDPEVRRCYWKV